MFFRDKDKPMVSKFLILCSVICAVLAVVGAFGPDFYLASTQWLLVALVFASWATYILLEAEFRL